MSDQDQIKLHADRAMNELDLARAAASHRAARAHLALSALHIERLNALSDTAAAPCATASPEGAPQPIFT